MHIYCDIYTYIVICTDAYAVCTDEYAYVQVFMYRYAYVATLIVLYDPVPYIYMNMWRSIYAGAFM